jgi:hypothetical protein
VRNWRKPGFDHEGTDRRRRHVSVRAGDRAGLLRPVLAGDFEDPRFPAGVGSLDLFDVLPFGPANAVTSASIIAYITCKPAPTARASSPSFADSTICPNDTSTCSGIAGVGLVSTAFFW